MTIPLDHLFMTATPSDCLHNTADLIKAFLSDTDYIKQFMERNRNVPIKILMTTLILSHTQYLKQSSFCLANKATILLSQSQDNLVLKQNNTKPSKHSSLSGIFHSNLMNSFK